MDTFQGYRAPIKDESEKNSNYSKLIIRKNPEVQAKFKRELEEKFPEEILKRLVKEIHKQY